MVTKLELEFQATCFSPDFSYQVKMISRFFLYYKDNAVSLLKVFFYVKKKLLFEGTVSQDFLP